MTITILTLFPDIFPYVFSSSIIGRAQKKGKLNLKFVNIRDFGIGSHKTVDDKPYGGGVGMLLRTDVVHKSIKSVKKNIKSEKCVLLDPAGKSFDQSVARSYSKLSHLILVCGHYEGFDYRIHKFIDESVSIGDYILTGGEIPAMVVCDAVSRLIPGVLSKPEAVNKESFASPDTIEYPQYTRPQNYMGFKVPELLLSGNHQKIEDWRRQNQKSKLRASAKQ